MVLVEVKLWQIVASWWNFLEKVRFSIPARLYSKVKKKNYSTYPSPIVDLHRKISESLENSIKERRINMDT